MQSFQNICKYDSTDFYFFDNLFFLINFLIISYRNPQKCSAKDCAKSLNFEFERIGTPDFLVTATSGNTENQED